jgi:hypothetical protein
MKLDEGDYIEDCSSVDNYSPAVSLKRLKQLSLAGIAAAEWTLMMRWMKGEEQEYVSIQS